MLSPTEILRLARAYAEAEEVALSTVAQRACPKNHKIFGRLAKGHGANSHTLAAIENFFYANWPEDAAWPADIARRRTAKPACAA